MSRVHLLDTNIFSVWVDGDHERHTDVLAQVEELGDAFLFVSVVTVAEVEHGLARPHRLSIELVREIRRGLSSFRVLEIGRHVAEPYGKLRAWLVENKAPRDKRKRLTSLSQLIDPITDQELMIQENDLWLASQAIANEAVLVTLDRMTHIRQAAAGTQQELHIAQW